MSLLMSDTDSFLLHVEGDPVNQRGIGKILRRNREYFDFSRLQNGHPLKDNTNAQVPGEMKLQLPDSIIMEAVVLSSKCYSVLTDRGSLSAMKGTPGSLQHEIYRDYIAREKLVGCFGLNGPLRQYFSLYRAVSQREGERGEKGQMREKMSKPPPPAPTASATGPCPTTIQISRTPQHWKFTQHLRTTRPPPREKCYNFKVKS